MEPYLPDVLGSIITGVIFTIANGAWELSLARGTRREVEYLKAEVRRNVAEAAEDREAILQRITEVRDAVIHEVTAATEKRITDAKAELQAAEAALLEREAALAEEAAKLAAKQELSKKMTDLGGRGNEVKAEKEAERLTAHAKARLALGDWYEVALEAFPEVREGLEKHPHLADKLLKPAIAWAQGMVAQRARGGGNGAAGATTDPFNPRYGR